MEVVTICLGQGKVEGAVLGGALRLLSNLKLRDHVAHGSLYLYSLIRR